MKLMVCMNNASIFTIAAEMASELDSLYKDNRFGKADLLDFMDANDWFGVEKQPDMLTTHDFYRFKAPLTLWLSAYRKPGREKIGLMLRHFSDVYPITCQVFSDFVTVSRLEDTPSAWKLLDFLLSEIDHEITMYDEAGLEGLARRADSELALGTARLLARFFQEAKVDGKPLTQWVYTFDSRDSPELVRDAYSIDRFSVMAYCVFNESMWARQGLIEKAVQNKSYADLWLFASLHFICALRAGDMARLPAPALPYDHNTVLKKILDSTFERREAVALVEEMSIRLNLKPMKPSKTSAHGNVPDLKLFVPESLKAPLGIIIAISLAHHPEVKPGDGFVSPSGQKCNRNAYAIRNFFGDHFAKALGMGPLSSRRCNKSYLQGIDITTPRTPGKPKGYMLASLARSHKSGIASLAKTTDIYLKDATFSGYSPEFIIREMFERGVFGFIPAILLEMYAGSEYKLLPISSQTALIGELGLEAYQIEWLIGAVNNALMKSREAVNAVLRNQANIRESIANTLQNIASGNAPSRQDAILCLMTAAGLPCPSADRASCIGCSYEIFTKTAMHTLVNEYTRLSRLKSTTVSLDAMRYKLILEQAVLPAISEILASAKLLYPESDMGELLDIVERGVELAEHGL